MQYPILVLILSLCACGSVSNNTQPDAQVTPTPDACVPETDTQLCARLTDACEGHTAEDNCGTDRTVDCGACASGKGCVVGQCKTPVCTTFNYARTNISAFTQAGIEDSIGGATWDGRVILYIKSVGGAGTCGNFTVVVADETAPGAGTYTQTDATSNLVALGLFIGQEGYSIAADGLTLVALTDSRKQIVTTKRSALGMIDFGATSPTLFDAINATITAGDPAIFYSPNISADGLELFYTVLGYTGADATKNGAYSSVRSSTTVPFPAGTRLPAPINDGQHGSITGVSSDRLAVFVFYNFTSHVFTRRSTSQPFTNPNAPADPPTLEGWAHKALEDCSKLLGQYSPGGCAAEDVVLLTRQ